MKKKLVVALLTGSALSVLPAYVCTAFSTDVGASFEQPVSANEQVITVKSR